MDLPDPDDRLNSWKEIAAFLGRTIRTVQRWEKTERLPLRRGGPGQRGAVVASKRELSEWWERRSADAAPAAAIRVRAIAAVCLIAVAMMSAAGLPLLWRVGAVTENPIRVGRLLAASTSEGRTFTTIPLPGVASALEVAPSGRLAFVAIADEHAVDVIDLATRRIVRRYDVVDQPHRLVLKADEERLFIGGSSELGLLDLRRRTLTRFDPGGAVRDVYVSADGRRVWVTLAQAGLKILDVERGTWDVIPTVGCPMHLTPAPRSRRLFVSYQCGGPGGRPGHDTIEIVDEIGRAPLLASAGLPLVGSPLALSPDEEHLWTDARDACVNPEYDRAGCPPGHGPVLHALRARTLEHLLTVRIPGRRQDSRPVFLPDGTRLLLGGFDLTVIDRALGTVLESAGRESGFGAFTADGTRFLSLDLESGNRALLEIEVSPPIDPAIVHGAVTHWSGDGTANDIVGGTHGASTEGVRFSPGQYGQAFAFDAMSQGLNFGRRLDADISFGPATYAAWIKLRERSGPSHIASRDSSHPWTWSISHNGQLSFCLVRATMTDACDVGQATGHMTLNPDRWYHVAVVRTDSAITLFVDGEPDGFTGLGAFRPPAVLDPAVLRLGAGPNGSAPFNGLIDEVVLFRRSLSADEISRLMRATTIPPRHPSMTRTR